MTTCSLTQCLALLSLAIATAAIEMLSGDFGIRSSRKLEIMADAAYAILCKNSREITGKFLIDDEVIRQEGITDLEPYANCPGMYVCIYENMIIN